MTVSVDMDEREAAELVSIEGRLMAEYGPSLGPDAVMRCIADAVDHFNDAPYAPMSYCWSNAGRPRNCATRRAEPVRMRGTVTPSVLGMRHAADPC